jgi:hypothetical protein
LCTHGDVFPAVRQVETFGSMDKREKAEFLLEQVRLCLTQRDFVKMQIISNKVSKRVLDEDGFEVCGAWPAIVVRF